uniref:Protein PRD1 n=1 Tax=Ananas comosus var. bracteatus TaxID=296719 RepID=A0A6V7NNZ5_ANACO|nr:unnamed protein product [Ananas comosus var. bracteatus]
MDSNFYCSYTAFGVLLNCHQDDRTATNIRNKAALFSNLVQGLWGDLVVLYKLFLLQGTPWEEGDNEFDALVSREKLLRFSLEVLLKAQNDDARLNCLGQKHHYFTPFFVSLLNMTNCYIYLLSIAFGFGSKGFFENLFASEQTGIDMGDADNFMHTDESALNSPLINLFAEAIKGPLLSCDTQVQTSTLDLIFHSLSSDFNISEQIKVLVEENVADYIFEVLRLSGKKDPLIISCLQVLDLFATEEETFIQTLTVGFPMLLSTLRYVAEIPFHPVQTHVLRLVFLCISNCPGIISMPQLVFWTFGLYPSDLMKTRVYLMLSSLIDRIIGSECGEAIQDAYACLPSDPLDLIYLLGQRSSHDLNLASCQCAILVLLYVSTLYGERLASENEVLAALEQYIIVNNTNFSCGISDSMILTQLILLYSLIRASSVGYSAAYNAEAEKTIFRLISEKEWDLLTISIHPLALNWLFQQEALLSPLSYQLLNFSKFYSSNKNQICVHLDKMQIMDIQMIAQLVVSGNNYVIQILVLLLKEVGEEGREDDAISVMNVLGGLLEIYPKSSNQLCLEGFADALRCSYYSTHSLQNFMTCSLIVFNVLYSANCKALIQEGEWLSVIQKLLEHLKPKSASQSCGQEEYLVIAILCIVLRFSTNQVLIEPAKAILFSNSLVSSVEKVVQTACTKGPALSKHEEDTTLGESLIFVLLLNLFALKSLHAILQDTIDWQDYLQLSDEVDTLSVLSIKCHDLCRLLYSGSSLVKLVASQCLLELLTRISEQRNSKGDELRCSWRYLESMMAVIEGLLFYGDYLVARNCGMCFAMILGWEKFGLVEKRAIKDSKWCRIVMEEFVMALAAPGLTSRCFTNQHKPAAYMAVTLLKLDRVPEWMKSLFDSSCISG